MKNLFTLLVFIGISKFGCSQYDINSFHYGISINKNVGITSEIGGGIRAEYAMNCSTTFIAEYNRSFALEEDIARNSYNEIALGANIILFNWFPTTITAGIGYIGNDSSIFDSIEENAYLSFTTGNFNHGAQIKLRGIQELTEFLHLFGELNIKSLGRRYDTVVLGLSYDFY